METWGDVTAVDLPFEEGLKRERELFTGLVTGEQSRALRHAFFAERAATKVDDIPADTPLIPIARVGVLGAGTMGGGIAMCFAIAGLRTEGVVIKDPGCVAKSFPAFWKTLDSLHDNTTSTL